MDYKKHYTLLIKRATNRTLEGYTEKHHIIPKCLGGLDNKDNIAVLTPEEHFVAHQLLIKIHPGNRDLVYAVQLMTVHNTNSRVNNKLFGWIRKQCSLAMSIQSKLWYETNEHPKGFLGKTHSNATKNQIRNTCKQKITELKGVKIYAYNLDGSFFKEYITITDCALDLKTTPSNVKYTADGKFGHCKQKQLRHEYTERIAPYVKPKVNTYERSNKHRENLSSQAKTNTAICKHCGLESIKANITRWHNDNCKYRLQETKL